MKQQILGNKIYVCSNDPGPRFRLGELSIKTQYEKGVPFFFCSDNRVQRWCAKYPRLYIEVNSIEEYIKSLPKEQVKKEEVKQDDKLEYSKQKYQELMKLAKKKGLHPDPAMSKKDVVELLEKFDGNSALPERKNPEDSKRPISGQRDNGLSQSST